MTRIPASGAMTWNDIQNSFGGSNPIAINEYYRTGANVPNSDLNSNIPTSGQIEASDFRGADGFSGTTGSITAGTSGGKAPQVGFLAGSYGSNLGTAITSGSAGNGSFKFNFYKIDSDIIGVNIGSTIVSPATATQSSMSSKTMSFTGGTNAPFAVAWANNGNVQTPPSSFATSSSDGCGWVVGVTQPTANQATFVNGQTYGFSIN